MGYMMSDHIQTGLPAEYMNLKENEWYGRILQAKKQLGQDLLIVGHHYQRDDVIQFADFTGDSFKLARLAEKAEQAKFIVFCGVHFMAETADILTSSAQKVILPDLNAGCSMADMADMEQVEDCWTEVTDLFGGTTIPITYVNSAANLKAFCGANGGAVCTSSNAKKMLTWAFEQGERILFFPDEFLGRNTATALEIPDQQMVVYNQASQTFEWLPGQKPEDVKVILWKGFCSVHQRFHMSHVDSLRKQYPTIKVLVHPECSHEVVNAADLSGSTEFIISQVEAAPPDTIWAIGTEINLVSRLAKAHPEQRILSLNPIVCPCSTMYRISPQHLLWVLETILKGEVVNQITVSEKIAHHARIALNRMLQIA
ncbi:quinolinate synthase NadA [Aneurinibacillus sp. Ricciae_BoGa-3]|uniref:quinolinate synthase NadA n=1 Tax=Aneurinibacillus sp. Ricciae_BoGa-3 TaxID=3022697 RepID=UPI00233F8982|nr:quinolinate synthase NadA [Aneurinibacillus sp. Ricciae_BoGa-3]WCK54861.1 quinolinate synthase NadA [Aneurinibacillus sp. Ricciae_BoGa-3]